MGQRDGVRFCDACGRTLGADERLHQSGTAWVCRECLHPEEDADRLPLAIDIADAPRDTLRVVPARAVSHCKHRQGRAKRYLMWLLVIPLAAVMLTLAVILIGDGDGLVGIPIAVFVVFMVGAAIRTSQRPQRPPIIVCPNVNCGYRGQGRIVQRDASNDGFGGLSVLGSTNRRWLICPACGVQVREV